MDNIVVLGSAHFDIFFSQKRYCVDFQINYEPIKVFILFLQRHTSCRNIKLDIIDEHTSRQNRYHDNNAPRSNDRGYQYLDTYGVLHS